MKKHPLVLVVACALVNADNQVLFAQRPEGKSMAGLWEFPGGKVEPDETPEETLVRELYEELGLMVRTEHLTPLVFASHAYDAFHLLMPLYVCRQFEGRPMPREGQALQWVSSRDFAHYPMPAADIPLLPPLRALLARS